MVLNLVLVRHGARAHGRAGTGLNEHGELQMERLAEALSRRGTLPDHIVTSSRDHARQSAMHLAGLLPVPRLPVSELRSLTPAVEGDPPAHRTPSDLDTFLAELAATVDL